MTKRARANMNDQFRDISDLTKFIFASRDPDEIYSRLTEGVCAHSQWDLSGIQFLDVDLGKVIPLVRYDNLQGTSQNDFQGWDADISPTGRVLKDGEPLVLLDAQAQSEFSGYREDAVARNYHTVVVIPLEVKDEMRRQMVYYVASRSILTQSEVDIGFLKCVAELSTIAIRKLRDVKREQKTSERLRLIVDHINSSLSRNLDAEAAGSMASALSGLFPASWLAIDLTSGRLLFDEDNPPPIPFGDGRRAPVALVTAALEAKNSISGQVMKIDLDGVGIDILVTALRIDETHVGSLFFFECTDLKDQEVVASQAGQLAVSSFILRSFIEFKSRKTTSRRLIKRLFSRDWDKMEEIFDEAHQLDFDLNLPCRILLICGPDGSEITDQMHSYILRTVQEGFGPAISGMIDGQLAILVSDGQSNFSDIDKKGFLSRLSAFLLWSPVLVLSERPGSIRDLPKIFSTSVNTMNVGVSMEATGWISSKTVGEFSTLMATADMARIEGYLERIIQPLQNLGPRKTETALSTIGTFLSTGRRYQEAADLLNIHVSTLRYRLEQLSDRNGINFDDPDTCFELDMAIRLQKLKNSYKK